MCFIEAFTISEILAQIDHTCTTLDIADLEDDI